MLRCPILLFHASLLNSETEKMPSTVLLNIKNENIGISTGGPALQLETWGFILIHFYVIEAFQKNNGLLPAKLACSFPNAVWYSLQVPLKKPFLVKSEPSESGSSARPACC